MAYSMILKWHAQDIPERRPGSMYTLKRNFMWQLAQGQLKRAAERRLQKALRERKAA
jgi:hypothetical protein